MVVIHLQIKCKLDHVKSLSAKTENFVFYFLLNCTNCRTEIPKIQSIASNEIVKTKNSKISVNFLIKCKNCNRESTITVIQDSFQKYTDKDEGSLKTIASFDCRGIEPIVFYPKNGWVIQTECETYEDVDLSENEWVEYDSTIKHCVGIYDLKWSFK